MKSSGCKPGRWPDADPLAPDLPGGGSHGSPSHRLLPLDDLVPVFVARPAAPVPGFYPIQDDPYCDYHHTAADTLDKLDPATLRENCAVMAVLAYAL
ncbi:MAG: hypothetical protein AB1758_37125, partial [Candidatus Eremiobacterota bacterium]